MYESAESTLERILELAARCPKELQAKCFEILLDGYAKVEIARTLPAAATGASAAVTTLNPSNSPPPPPVDSQVPPAVLPRFKNAAKRIDVPLEKLEALFDFSVDPFGLHAVNVPGDNKAEKARNVALLVAARAYLATGTWAADWQEVKAQCVDQNCYDTANHALNLRKGSPKLFKPIEAGKAIELASVGVQEAEKLLKKLAVGKDEPK